MIMRNNSQIRKTHQAFDFTDQKPKGVKFLDANFKLLWFFKDLSD